MTDGVIALDDLQSSSTGAEQNTTNSDSDTSSAYESLRDACEDVGANYESAREYVDENGKKTELIEFATAMYTDDDDSIAALYEEYRRVNDVHRIVVNHLRSHAADFDEWTNKFYYGGGDSDNPGEGSYNDVQSRAADEKAGNLPFYKALFPEPNTDHWDSEAVLWEERPGEDSHIYVTRDFAEQYSQFSRKINGKERPVPPSNEDIQSMNGDNSGSSGGSGSTAAPINPANYSVDTLNTVLGNGDFPVDELKAILESEKSGENRKTAKKKINREIRQASGGSADTDDTSTAAAAGRIHDENNMTIDAETTKELLDDDMAEEEIIERFSA